MKRRYIILQLLGLCSVLPVFMATVSAQNNIVVRAQMDSAAIMMGDQTTVRLEVSQDKDKFVRLPIIQDTLVTGVEVLKVSKPDTIDLKNNRIQINNEVLVTSFDSGLYYLPPFKYVIEDDTFETQALSLKVVPVPVDTTACRVRYKRSRCTTFRIDGLHSVVGNIFIGRFNRHSGRNICILALGPAEKRRRNYR